ncbi:hypothetical protein J6590_003868 [Homalodisca vitripennis]|nr:hypothetical protein J6590_003868 [Homalodisca vitripennis]
MTRPFDPTVQGRWSCRPGPASKCTRRLGRSCRYNGSINENPNICPRLGQRVNTTGERRCGATRFAYSSERCATNLCATPIRRRDYVQSHGNFTDKVRRLLRAMSYAEMPDLLVVRC